MSKSAVLFNGIRFPFAVIDRSFEWAKKEKGVLLAVFLLSNDTEPEGYIFPSDIDEAENLSDAADSTADNDKIVESNIQMLNHRALAENINFQAVVLHDPSEQTLSDTVVDCNYIFAGREVNEVSIGTVESVNLPKWFNSFAGTVEMI